MSETASAGALSAYVHCLRAIASAQIRTQAMAAANLEAAAKGGPPAYPHSEFFAVCDEMENQVRDSSGYIV